jgi:threonine aldolase
LRKTWGGGMRQAGILAAAALHALDHNLRGLADDHEKARTLARAVDRSPGLRLAYPVETNILIVEVVEPRDTAAAAVDEMKRQGLLASMWEERRFRLVTHRDASFEDIERAAEILARLRG